MKFRSVESALMLSPLSMRFALLLLFVAGAGVSTVALAASDTIVDCDRVESSLRSFEVPIDELAGDEDDLVTAEPDESSNTTPVLLLTPRAAIMTRQVFDALPIVVIDGDGSELDANDTASSHDEEPATESSPLVLAPQMPSSRPAKEPEALPDNSQYLPRFQRQMYRTDI